MHLTDREKTKMRIESIGYVEFLRDRLYEKTARGSILVPAGQYELVKSRATNAIGFRVIGYPAQPAFKPQKIGEGMYLIDPSDRPISTESVTFIRWIVGDSEEFLESDICKEGHSEQRFRISLKGAIE